MEYSTGVCYACHGTREKLDYDESKRQNRDIWRDCGGCQGLGRKYFDAGGNRIYKKSGESVNDFLTRIKRGDNEKI